MLVDRRTKRLAVPHEPDEWMELRRLTFAELAELRQESGVRFLEGLTGLPEDVLHMQLQVQAEMAEARREARSKGGDEAAEADEAPAADVLDGIDLLTVLRFGIVAWSYVEDSGEPVPIEPGSVAMLDDETARWAAREILLLGKEVAERQKKGSSFSTATSTE